MDGTGIKQAVTDFISKYKFAVLVFAVGLLLMILPDTKATEQKTENQITNITQEDSMEDKLSHILSSVKGAGQVQVMLSYASGQETVYQMDTDVSKNESNQTEKKDTVTVTDSDRNQIGLVQRIDPPTCQGALIVCQGADDAAVKLAIVEAVARITGLSTDKICVLKMK